MPGENVEVVRRWWDRLARGDLAADLWDEDLVIENVETLAFEGTYRGHEGLARWWRDLSEVLSDVRVELEEATELDEERVLAMPRVRGHFRTTGLEFDGPWAAVMTVHDGQIAYAKGYATKKRALRELGLGRD
jgi:ketosteroid isomerase-like protein